MNVLDATVTEVKASPYKAYDKWWVKVEYDCYGVYSDGVVMCATYEEAAAVDIGYVFQV